MSLSTTLVTDAVIPLLSLSGLLGGLLLSYLAREELTEGRRYFVLLYRILFLLLSFTIIYFILNLLSIPITMLFFFLAILLIVLDIKKPSRLLFLIHYLFFLAGYFAAGKQTIIAVVLFLYGLPVGTLLGMKDE